jgi:hypothetical protein
MVGLTDMIIFVAQHASDIPRAFWFVNKKKFLASLHKLLSCFMEGENTSWPPNLRLVSRGKNQASIKVPQVKYFHVTPNTKCLTIMDHGFILTM